jgi:hypothetical protein
MDSVGNCFNLAQCQASRNLIPMLSLPPLFMKTFSPAYIQARIT